MEPGSLLALCVFAVVSSLSPGPSNFMLMASGANFGFRRSLPQLLGVCLGLTSLMLGVGLGLGTVLAAFPALGLALKIGGGAYLLYLAWRIGTARSMGKPGEAAARPLTLLESAALQVINPKAWYASVTAMAVYTNAAAPFRSALLIALVFAPSILPSLAAWVSFGIALRGFLANPARLKAFNITMGLLLAATLWPMIR